MPAYFIVACIRLFLAALARRVSLVHVHMSERLSVFRKGLVVHLAKLFRIPVVLHLHGADFADYCRSLPPNGLARVKKMVGKADVVITLGQYWRNFVRDELGVDDSRIAVLHNAVPGPQSVPARVGGKTCRILFLGVVCERKGMPTLLEALAHESMMALDWQLEVAGDGEIAAYQAEAERLGLDTRVTFHGWVDEKGARRFLSQCDVLVLPSRNEGLPMAILEAMAYGMAVVATPVGSIADAIRNGENGSLVPVRDSAALASALASLVRDPSLRQRMGAMARQTYEQHFEISAYNNQLARIFERAKERSR
jgi:glycosyltransferase involved in cell wall biosynthesis